MSTDQTRYSSRYRCHSLARSPTVFWLERVFARGKKQIAIARACRDINGRRVRRTKIQRTPVDRANATSKRSRGRRASRKQRTKSSAKLVTIRRGRRDDDRARFAWNSESQPIARRSKAESGMDARSEPDVRVAHRRAALASARAGEQERARKPTGRCYK